jgi:hypothetical protein
VAKQRVSKKRGGGPFDADFDIQLLAAFKNPFRPLKAFGNRFALAPATFGTRAFLMQRRPKILKSSGFKL